MRLQKEDSVILTRRPEVVGIVQHIAGDQVTVWVPSDIDGRKKCSRSEVRPLAELLAEFRSRGTNVWGVVNLNGESTFADLVTAFGYSTRRLRQESLEKVVRQLQRAGLKVVSVAGGSSRNDRFRLDVVEGVSEDPAPPPPVRTPGPTVRVEIPETFWPTAFGLRPPDQEAAFLHALMDSRPILCILEAPEEATSGWLQAAWEGMVSWAFRSAQKFVRRGSSDSDSPDVQVGPASLLHTFLKLSVLDIDTPQLQRRPHSLNLITIRPGSDLPVDFDRLRAVWPGPVFCFDPELSGAAASVRGRVSSDILGCLLLAAGCPPQTGGDPCPLKTLLWSEKASTQILLRATARLGELLSAKTPQHFKGSNEGSTALALKADVAAWIKRTHKGADLEFESHEEEDTGDLDDVQDVRDVRHIRRVDLSVKGVGWFEVESLIGSGPIEAFYHQKVFSRLKRADSPMWLVVPNAAVLWAGPYLADIRPSSQ
jgi:hypothetical protein